MDNNYIQSTITERLQKAVRYLRQKHLISNQIDLAKKMGITPITVSRSMTGVYKGEKFARDLNSTFGYIFSDSWLLHGIGEMLASANYTPPAPPKTPEDRIIEVYNQVVNDYEHRIRELDAIISETKQLRDDLRAAITQISKRSTINQTYNLALDSIPTAAEPSEQ